VGGLIGTREEVAKALESAGIALGRVLLVTPDEKVAGDFPSGRGGLRAGRRGGEEGRQTLSWASDGRRDVETAGRPAIFRRDQALGARGSLLDRFSGCS